MTDERVQEQDVEATEAGAEEDVVDAEVVDEGR